MVVDTQNRYADDITVQELVRLRVENDRFRKALEDIREIHGGDVSLIWKRMKWIAEAALNKEKSNVNHG